MEVYAPCPDAYLLLDEIVRTMGQLSLPSTMIRATRYGNGRKRLKESSSGSTKGSPSIMVNGRWHAECMRRSDDHGASEPSGPPERKNAACVPVLGNATQLNRWLQWLLQLGCCGADGKPHHKRHHHHRGFLGWQELHPGYPDPGGQLLGCYSTTKTRHPPSSLPRHVVSPQSKRH